MLRYCTDVRRPFPQGDGDAVKKEVDGALPHPVAFTDVEGHYQNQALMHKKLATSYLRDLRVHRYITS